MEINLGILNLFIKIIMSIIKYINPYFWKEVNRIKKYLRYWAQLNGGNNYSNGNGCYIPHIGSRYYKNATNYLSEICYLNIIADDSAPAKGRIFVRIIKTGQLNDWLKK